MISLIDNNDDRSSVLVEIYGRKYRALVDSGAEISLIHRKITEHFPDTECLNSTEIKLRSATGDSIGVVGEMDLNFKLGKKHLRHTFVVAENISRSVILGRDCLKAHNIKLDFGSNHLILSDEIVNLESDEYITSLVRVANKKVLKPQTSTLIWGKCKRQKEMKQQGTYCISGIDSGFISQEPGLMITNSVIKMKKNKKFPVLVCNSTNKTIRLRRGNVVARAEKINDEIGSVSEISEITFDDSGSEDEHLSETNNIPLAYQKKLEELLELNKDLFAATDIDLGRTDAVKMKIDTGDHPPIRLKPYRTPLTQRPVIDKAIDDMLKADIIQPSKSSWSFPILLVPKKGTDEKRFCVDFRKLNNITKNYVWPLPHIDDILASLKDSRVFSTIDLKSGYWQIPMDEKDKEKVAFTCHRGLYQFNSMPFGLSCAPSVFQELMTQVLEGINGKFAMAYLDDILVHSPTVEEHVAHLTEVFDRLRKFGLKMKQSKCKFMQSRINYLGFVVDTEGVQADPEKVRVIKEMSRPTDVRGVRAFIGCVSYYRRFCPRFSEIALPLINLTKKHARFEWTDKCQEAFDKLKEMMCEAPTLSFPDPNREYVLYTDASAECIGAVLTQDFGTGEQPIHYLSHKLSDSQRKWPILEKEAYAIYYSLQKLDHYLHGAKITIKCDHKPLKYLFSSEMKNRKVQMWAIAISSYNCTVEYIKGKDNEQADLLSRLPHEEQAVEKPSQEIGVINSDRVTAVTDSEWDQSEEIDDGHKKMELGDIGIEQELDPELRKLRKTLERPMTTESVKKRYAIVEGLLYYIENEEQDEPGMRLLIPEKYKELVLKQFHDNCAHWGIDKTFNLIKRNYHWIGLYKDVVNYVTHCVTCRTRSSKQNKTALQEMEEVQYPMQKLGLDLCGPYPESLDGNRYILTAVCQFSGWAEAYAIPNKKTETIVRVVMDEIIPRHSCPEKILTDNGTEFKSRLFDEMCSELNIVHLYTSPYHPAGNGKTERFHRVLNDMLSKKTARSLENWDQYLPAVLAAYRVGMSETTGYSPFFLLYVRDPVLPLDNLLKPRRRYLGEDYHKISLERQHQTFMNMRRNLRKARNKQKKYHDRDVKEIKFQVGDPVYLRNQNRQSKLDDKWISHYRVIELNSPVTSTIRNQLTGDVKRVHNEHLVLADLTDWPVPAPRKDIRKARYVVTPEETDTESESYVTAEGSDSEDDVPLAMLRQRWTEAE